MPLDAFAQFERQARAVFAPRPALGQVGDDRIKTVLRLVLVVKREFVSPRHPRDRYRVRTFLVDRHARRAVPVIDPEHPAGLLRLRALVRNQRQQHCRRDASQVSSPHAPPVSSRGKRVLPCYHVHICIMLLGAFFTGGVLWPAIGLRSSRRDTAAIFTAISLRRTPKSRMSAPALRAANICAASGSRCVFRTS